MCFVELFFRCVVSICTDILLSTARNNGVREFLLTDSSYVTKLHKSTAPQSVCASEDHAMWSLEIIQLTFQIFFDAMMTLTYTVSSFLSLSTMPWHESYTRRGFIGFSSFRWNIALLESVRDCEF